MLPGSLLQIRSYQPPLSNFSQDRSVGIQNPEYDGKWPSRDLSSSLSSPRPLSWLRHSSVVVGAKFNNTSRSCFLYEPVFPVLPHLPRCCDGETLQALYIWQLAGTSWCRHPGLINIPPMKPHLVVPVEVKVVVSDQQAEVLEFPRVLLIRDLAAPVHAFERFAQLGLLHPAKLVVRDGDAEPFDVREGEMLEINPRSGGQVAVPVDMVVLEEVSEGFGVHLFADGPQSPKELQDFFNLVVLSLAFAGGEADFGFWKGWYERMIVYLDPDLQRQCEKVEDSDGIIAGLSLTGRMPTYVEWETLGRPFSEHIDWSWHGVDILCSKYLRLDFDDST